MLFCWRLIPTLSPLGLLFESVSAIATVGVSMDLTPNLNTLGRPRYHVSDVHWPCWTYHCSLELDDQKEKHVSYAPTDISVG